MKIAILIVSLLLLMLLAYVYYVVVTKKEHFQVSQTTEEKVIQLYESVLLRQPTSQELVQNSRNLNGNKLTWDGLKQKLMDSDEYSFNIKLQSNALSPELEKMLSESRILNEISNIYKRIRGDRIPPKMILPLRDLYVVLEYNPFLLAAMLQHEKYRDYEQDLILINELNKDRVVELFHESFDQVKLTEQAVQLAKDPMYQNIIQLHESGVHVNQVQTPANNNDLTLSASEQEDLRNMLKNYNQIRSLLEEAREVSRTIEENILYPPSDESGEMSIDSTQQQQTSGVKQSGTATKQSQSLSGAKSTAKNSTKNNTRKTYTQVPGMRGDPTHQGQMVLRPEFAWSVPQKRPPVCTTPGQPAVVQPLLTNSELLLGTPLTEAKQTQVGSIMPGFEYKQ
jgi:hypothetical protein